VLTKRSPSGVQASIRASFTRAHTRAVHPAGTVSWRGVDSAPPPSPAGTTRVVFELAHIAGFADDIEADEVAADDDAADDDPDDDDPDDAVGGWLAVVVHAATAATAATASTVSGRRRKVSVMGSPPSPVRAGQCTRKRAAGIRSRSSAQRISG
jgi:hypothetical protein